MGKEPLIAIGYCVSTLGANIIYFEPVSDIINLTMYLVAVQKVLVNCARKRIVQITRTW